MHCSGVYKILIGQVREQCSRFWTFEIIKEYVIIYYESELFLIVYDLFEPIPSEIMHDGNHQYFYACDRIKKFHKMENYLEINLNCMKIEQFNRIAFQVNIKEGKHKSTYLLIFSLCIKKHCTKIS